MKIFVLWAVNTSSVLDWDLTVLRLSRCYRSILVLHYGQCHVSFTTWHLWTHIMHTFCRYNPFIFLYLLNTELWFCEVFCLFLHCRFLSGIHSWSTEESDLCIRSFQTCSCITQTNAIMCVMYWACGTWNSHLFRNMFALTNNYVYLSWLY